MLSSSQASDLSDLWLHEQAIESRTALASGSTATSVQRGLTFALLAAAISRPGAAEAVMSPLHVLNDAGERALADLKVQHLYEEVRLETSAWMDVLVKAVGDQLFSNVKASAAAQFLSSDVVASSPFLFGDAGTPRRLGVLLEQRHLAVLGRSIDLRQLLTARLLRLFQQNAEHLISRFEAGSVVSVVELESQVAVLERAHSMLSTTVPLGDWSDFWRAANRASATPSSTAAEAGSDEHRSTPTPGRVAKHAASELTSSVVSSFTMVAALHKLLRTNGEAKAPVPAVPPMLASFLLSRYGSPESAGHTSFMAAHSGWIGAPHIAALLQLIGADGISWLVQRLREKALHVMRFSLPSCIHTATEALASQFQDCTFITSGAGSQASSAVYSFYRTQLESVLGYQALRAELVSGLSELGNCAMLVELADAALQTASRQEFIQGAPFMGVTPARATGGLRRPTVPHSQPEQEPEPFTPIGRLIFASAVRAEEDGGVADLAASLEQQVHSHFWGSSLPYIHLQTWLLSLREAAKACTTSLSARADHPWDANQADNQPQGKGTASSLASYKFHHLLSALLFVLADDASQDAGVETSRDLQGKHGRPSAQSLSASEMMGDSLQWGSAVLLCLLQQERRWVLMDFCKVIADAAALEGPMPSTRRSSAGELMGVGTTSSSSGTVRGKGGRPGPTSRLAAFVRCAQHFHTRMAQAVSAMKAALPAATPGHIRMPHISQMRQAKAARSVQQICIQPDRLVSARDIQVDAVPEASSTGSEAHGDPADDMAYYEEEVTGHAPRSPDSLASVTTKNSPAHSMHANSIKELTLPAPIQEDVLLEKLHPPVERRLESLDDSAQHQRLPASPHDDNSPLTDEGQQWTNPFAASPEDEEYVNPFGEPPRSPTEDPAVAASRSRRRLPPPPPQNLIAKQAQTLDD